MTKTQKTEQTEALEELRKLLPPGTTVYTILRHVSRSGMFRRISPMLMRHDNTYGVVAFHLDSLASIALGMNRVDNGNGIGVSGCGMDMGFDLVYRIGYALYPQGFAVEGIGRNGDTSGRDSDGGYALKQRWL